MPPPLRDPLVRAIVREIIRRERVAEAWLSRRRAPERKPAPPEPGTSERLMAVLADGAPRRTPELAAEVGVSEDAARGALRVLRQRGRVVSEYDAEAGRQRHRLAE